jgi:hypothetical protein
LGLIAALVVLYLVVPELLMCGFYGRFSQLNYLMVAALVILFLLIFRNAHARLIGSLENVR